MEDNNNINNLFEYLEYRHINYISGVEGPFNNFTFVFLQNDNHNCLVLVNLNLLTPRQTELINMLMNINFKVFINSNIDLLTDAIINYEHNNL